MEVRATVAQARYNIYVGNTDQRYTGGAGSWLRKRCMDLQFRPCLDREVGNSIILTKEVR